ncbi:YheC/YheD family protein [Paenibacillus qinlingensis]|uniref:Glutathione synthase/RimK-type ligase-like ATP-grasp enzyme n=1 Tax=Paenibacillus qinlingensis TaxID=1837343 RepID=A0ABU1NUH0_9BACL|nr:YheC/YheD family protein [Paenibacillus qinlingensis]MDR6551118.1 glutathione synthase/RimK-type ligase-like ATP-grasp enzyme [Paenibacillus qinlingensis]
MAAYKSSSIKSKWVKTKWLLQHYELRQYVPRTLLFTKTNLDTMIDSYKTVFLKPTGGSGGSNIIRIKRKTKGFQTQLNRKKNFYSTQKKLLTRLSNHAGKRSYLLQKGISLAKTKGRPFDIRVMVQKTNQGSWITTGLFTKIGRPGKVATNYNQGGTIGYFKSTMRGAGYSKADIQERETHLKQMGVTVGNTFDYHKRGFRELGLDVAIDSKGNPWILEVNTRPQFYPLKNMSNRKLYQRMVNTGKQYGRKK